MESLRAQVARMKAELHNQPYVSDGTQYSQLEELAYLQHHQQFVFTVEDYDQKIASLQAKVAQAEADVSSLTRQVSKLESVENIRKQLEKMQVGSKLNTFQAELDRESGAQKLEDARQALIGSKRDLASMIAERDSWEHQWYSDLQTQESQQERLLSDMQGQAAKNALRSQLVEMRAPADSIVLSVSRVAPGTVLQSGTQLMTTVPVDAPLEVVGMIDGGDSGFVKPGDPVSIKFDTLPYDRYGYAMGHVTRISADSFTDPTQGQVNPQSTSPNISLERAAEQRCGASLLLSRVRRDRPDEAAQPAAPASASSRACRWRSTSRSARARCCNTCSTSSCPSCKAARMSRHERLLARGGLRRWRG